MFGLLGPNGSGKSTLFKILATMLRPTEGNAAVFGQDTSANSSAVRALLGVVFQAPSVDVKLTARENLSHHGHMYGLSGKDLTARINDCFSAVKLSERADDRVETFSGGMRRRVEIAKVMLHQPKLLLLDEPATGLDPAARRDLWQHLHAMRDSTGVTIAVTTHLMDEAEHCDRLAILNFGKLVAVDTPEALISQIGGDVITVTPSTGQDINDIRSKIAQQFQPWPDHGEPTLADNTVVMQRDGGADFVAQLGSALPNVLQTISVGRPTLDDVFLQMTGNRLGETYDSQG